MKHLKKIAIIQMYAALSLLLLIIAHPVIAEESQEGKASEVVTITGTVTGDYQLVTPEGVHYDIAETEAGDDMLKNVGEKVKATGTMIEEEGYQEFSVTSYELIEKE